MADNQSYDLHTVPVTISGHYLVHLPKTDEPVPLLLGFHGYGENARMMMDYLMQVPGADKMAVCAVQGVHQFYQRRTGKVVASWMTWLGREFSIQSNIKYVRDVITQIGAQARLDGRIVFAGFSQGAAMAWRATAANLDAVSGVVTLGGDVPPDFKPASGTPRPPVLLARGKDDKICTDNLFAQDLERLRNHEFPVTDYVYDAGHEWTDEFSEKVGSFLKPLLQS